MKSKDNLINNLIEIQREDPYINDIINPVSIKIDKATIDIEDLKKQYIIDTATWGLNIWEKILKIKILPNKSMDERRSIIKAKLRGTGNCNAELLENVIDSWTNGDSIVTFHDGKIKVEFTSTIGIPTDLPSIEKSINEIKPAHLGVEFLFRYNTVKMLIDTNWTVKELADSSKTVIQVLGEKLIL